MEYQPHSFCWSFQDPPCSTEGSPKTRDRLPHLQPSLLFACLAAPVGTREHKAPESYTGNEPARARTPRPLLRTRTRTSMESTAGAPLGPHLRLRRIGHASGAAAGHDVIDGSGCAHAARAPSDNVEFPDAPRGPEAGAARLYSVGAGRGGVRIALRWPPRDDATAPTLGQMPPARPGRAHPSGPAPAGGN